MPPSLSLVPEPPAVPEQALVRRAIASDPEAVGELYDRFHRPVRVLAFRLLGDEMQAEDIVHDVFVALPKALAGFEGRSALKTFILAMTVNLSRKQVRSAVRRRAAMGRLAAEPPPSTGTPEGAHRQKQLAAALQRALAALPEPQREAFVLCVVEERDSAEVALMLDVPRGTVRTRLMHAKRKLRGMLSKRGIDEAGQ